MISILKTIWLLIAIVVGVVFLISLTIMLVCIGVKIINYFIDKSLDD